MVRAYLFLALFVPLTFLFSISAIISTLFDPSGRAYAWHARLWGRLGLAIEPDQGNGQRSRASPGRPDYLHE